MKPFLLALALSAPLSTSVSAAPQDFYDIEVLRTVDLQFHDVNWWTLLQQNYASQTNILADMTVEGIVYPDVGVRIRGNTSYTALPPGAEKVSLNVTVDFTHPGQDVMGASTLNLNNAFTDPTFCREVMFHNILAEVVPAGRANHIKLTLNGDNWGIYANIQQYGKDVLKEHFEDEDGLRIKCANNPFGPGLQYMGTNPASYSGYEIKDDGGLLDPIGELIAICDAVDNTPPAMWRLADQVFAIDPSIWEVVMENVYSDDDSYVNKGCDFVMYQNPIDGRTHLHQTDANESWTHPTWSVTHGFGAGNKPFLSNLLQAPELRGRYIAHMREALESFNWQTLGPQFLALRNRIDAEVQADPKKLYTYQNFTDNFLVTVNIGGFFNPNIVGLKEFVDQREALIAAHPEIAATPLDISGVTVSDDTPGLPTFITATISGTPSVFDVVLWYQDDPTQQYQSISMADDGLSGDGAAADGVYGVQLPFLGTGGQKVNYYVQAIAADAFNTQRFEPIQTELAPFLLAYSGGTAPSDVVINEFLAQNNTTVLDEWGSFEDYVELYNKGASTIDIGGMTMSDSLLTPTEWAIPAGTMLAPGDTILIWCDEDLGDGPLHADFKLGGGGEEIGLWASDGTLLDSIVYGPQVADVSTGRLNDGGDTWVTFADPTPDAVNDGACVRAYDQLDPTAHTLDLGWSGTGSIGSTLTLISSGFQPAGLAFLAIGSVGGHIPLDAGPVLLVGGPATIPVPADGVGAVILPAAIPDSVLLVGLDVYLQFAGTDILGGIGGSNALHLSICP